MLIFYSSSGLLIYAALVDLLAEDFLSEESNHTLTMKDKKIAFMWLILGGELFLLSSMYSANRIKLSACPSSVPSRKEYPCNDLTNYGRVNKPKRSDQQYHDSTAIMLELRFSEKVIH